MADQDQRPVVIAAEVAIELERIAVIPGVGAFGDPKSAVMEESGKIVVVEGDTKTEWEFTKLAAPVVRSPLVDPLDRKLAEELREVLQRDEERRQRLKEGMTGGD